jgi:hypothetical protein
VDWTAPRAAIPKWAECAEPSAFRPFHADLLEEWRALAGFALKKKGFRKERHGGEGGGSGSMFASRARSRRRCRMRCKWHHANRSRSSPTFPWTSRQRRQTPPLARLDCPTARKQWFFRLTLVPSACFSLASSPAAPFAPGSC